MISLLLAATQPGHYTPGVSSSLVRLAKDAGYIGGATSPFLLWLAKNWVTSRAATKKDTAKASAATAAAEIAARPELAEMIVDVLGKLEHAGEELADARVKNAEMDRKLAATSVELDATRESLQAVSDQLAACRQSNVELTERNGVLTQRLAALGQ